MVHSHNLRFLIYYPIKLSPQAGREIWSKKLEAEWPEEYVGLNATYLVEYEPVGSVFEALVSNQPVMNQFFIHRS